MSSMFSRPTSISEAFHNVPRPGSIKEAFSMASDQNDALQVELQKRKAARPAGPRLGSILGGTQSPEAGMMGSSGQKLGG